MGCRNGGPDYNVSQQLALDRGDNAIEVVAYNSTNLLASLPAQATIRFTGAADAVRPNLHVLAIGINKYVDRVEATRFGPNLEIMRARSEPPSGQAAHRGLRPRVRSERAHRSSEQRNGLGLGVAVLRLTPPALDSSDH